MKLVLGTVQFGLSYGVNNTAGIPSESEIQTILTYADEQKITKLDTASLYGNAEEKIGQYAMLPFQMITKFPFLTTKNELLVSFNTSISLLKSKSLYGYLAHNPNVFIEYPAVWQYLLELKEVNKVRKIGYSLYTIEQLEKLLNKNMIPDLIQFPYSVLDRKFETYFTYLKEHHVEIHVRSVFLQGLYLMQLDRIPERLLPLKEALLQMQELSKEFSVSLRDLVLNYVYENQYIDGIVIGVESHQQLMQNVDSIQHWKTNATLRSKINQINTAYPELLNPSNW